MKAPFHCPKCGRPLPSAKASCSLCLLDLAKEAADKPKPDPGFLSEFPADPAPTADGGGGVPPPAPPTEAVDPDAPAHPFEEQSGDVVGKYRLLEKLGEGGFGVVWRAQRTEDFQQEVAIKIVKPGMDTRAVVARFEGERQALALMDHPNIAQVFDGGITRSGRPYFVMELVRGEKITSYCKRERLTTRQRLELFMEVCHAVHHAHQQGFIHRDLKPDNILVTKYEDGTPVPKVIDFGMVKTMSGQKLSAGAWPTSMREFLGSLAYMSPEQAEAGISAFQVNAKTDIYSLGVVLYELLTGQTPLDAKRLREMPQTKALETISKGDFPSPSRRFSTLDQEQQVAIAQSQRLEPPKLLGLMRRELDWIVIRALNKDRRKRFDSAADFAKDIQRYLNNEVPESRSPSTLYRFQKVVRRNRLAFAAAGIVAAALAIGCAALTWALLRERSLHQETERAQQAEREQRLRAENLSVQFQKERDTAQAARVDAEREKSNAVASLRQAESERAKAVEAEQEARRAKASEGLAYTKAQQAALAEIEARRQLDSARADADKAWLDLKDARDQAEQRAKEAKAAKEEANRCAAELERLRAKLAASPEYLKAKQQTKKPIEKHAKFHLGNFMDIVRGAAAAGDSTNSVSVGVTAPDSKVQKAPTQIPGNTLTKELELELQSAPKETRDLINAMKVADEDVRLARELEKDVVRLEIKSRAALHLAETSYEDALAKSIPAVQRSQEAVLKAQAALAEALKALPSRPGEQR